MLLLPSQQTTVQQKSFRLLLLDGAVTLTEPCDCGGMIRHNNGGNYHKIVSFRLDAGTVFRSETFTGDYAPPNEWEETTFGKTIDEIADLAGRGWHAKGGA